MDQLNEQFLYSMTPEQLEKYRDELRMALAQTARFLEQVEKVVEVRDGRA